MAAENIPNEELVVILSFSYIKTHHFSFFQPNEAVYLCKFHYPAINPPHFDIKLFRFVIHDDFLLSLLRAPTL